MSAIHTKSLTGITSITTPSGIDNVFTVHSNDTTERFRIDQTGNQSIAGILTVSQDLDVDGHTELDNVNISGIVTVSSDGINAGILDLKTGNNLRLRFSSGGTAQFRGDTDPIASFDRGSANSTNVKWGYLGADRGIISSISNEFRITASGTIPMTFHSNGNERLRIDSSGNVLLNGGSLRIDGTGEFAVYESDTSLGFNNSAQISLDFSSNVARVRSTASGSGTNRPLALCIGSTERLRIASNGDFGFNDTSPTANASGNDTVLSIKGKGSSYSGKIDFKDSSGNIDNSIASDNTIFMFNCDPNSQNGNTAMLFSVHGSERFRFGRHGQLGIAGANYGTSGQVLTSQGSGSAVTWSTISGTTINNNADNRIITGSGTANTLNGESNVTIDSSSRVTINSTAHGDALTISSGGTTYGGSLHLTGTGSSNQDYVIAVGGGDNAYISGRGLLIRDITNSANRIGVLTNGNLLIHDGNLKLASGHGIDFSSTNNATNSASMQNELLDDYEEGTWTPFFYAWIGGGVPATTDIAVGTYTKIGRCVHINFDLKADRGSMNHNYITMGGLPFAHLGSRGGFASIAWTEYVGSENSTSATRGHGIEFGGGATVHCWLTGYTSTSSYLPVYLSTSYMSNGSHTRIQGSATYFTNA